MELILCFGLVVFPLYWVHLRIAQEGRKKLNLLQERRERYDGVMEKGDNEDSKREDINREAAG